ncbi:unnamed protein product [Nyctereutes procyonoides]|uniref:(raccoon dog) hypothetical protein n=1 Tax=Nyctereutes procyonoides TaxID=34880 RepID=A0A811YK47_NYCPR|nr:unnamed protein product [Nyctereutes procyonoides]
MRTPALTLRAGGWRWARRRRAGGGGGLAAAAAAGGDARPGRGGARVLSPSAAFASVFPRGASASEFARPPLPPWELIVPRRPRVRVSSPLGRGHPQEPDGHPGPWGSSSPCPRSQAMDTHLGCKSEPLAWTVILAVASRAGGAPPSARSRPPSARPGGTQSTPGALLGRGCFAERTAPPPWLGDLVVGAPGWAPDPSSAPSHSPTLVGAAAQFTYKERMHSSATVNISSKLCSAEIEILQMTLLRQWATWETSSKLHEGRDFVVLSAGPQLLRRLLTQKRPGHICTRYF